MFVFYPKAIIQNQLVNIGIVKKIRERLRNTGGGSLQSITYKKRIDRQIREIEKTIGKYWKGEIGKITELGYGRKPDVLNRLKKKYSGVKLVGIDIDCKEEIFENIRLTKNIRCASDSDIVYSFDVFEHIKEPESVLKELRNLIGPDNIFIVEIISL